MFNIEAIIWYIFLLDSITCNFIAHFGEKWYNKKYKKFSSIFPPKKGWALLYFAFVLWVGSALLRLGVLPW